jgi:hypothetical protein
MSDQMGKDELLLLGKISGQIEGVANHLARQDAQMAELDKKINSRIDGIDERLRTVEKKAAVAGALSGTAVSVGMALIIEGLKNWAAGGGR